MLENAFCKCVFFFFLCENKAFQRFFDERFQKIVRQTAERKENENFKSDSLSNSIHLVSRLFALPSR